MSEEIILSTLQRLEIPVAGAIIRDSDAGELYFVFISISRDHRNHQTPSNRLLKNAQNEIQSLGVRAEFLLTEPSTRDIESGLRATLLHEYGEFLRNAFMSVEKMQAIVWIEPKLTLHEDTLNSINKKTKMYLAQFDIDLISVTLTVGENLPSITVCISAIRKLAPVNIETLNTYLIETGFIVPSMDWLRRRLDTLRKNGKIVWMDQNEYALSMTTIRQLGTLKNRNSPDISRLLALAKGIR